MSPRPYTGVVQYASRDDVNPNGERKLHYVWVRRRFYLRHITWRGDRMRLKPFH